MSLAAILSIEGVRCPTCGAKPGRPCKPIGDEPATGYHVPRIRSGEGRCVECGGDLPGTTYPIKRKCECKPRPAPAGEGGER